LLEILGGIRHDALVSAVCCFCAVPSGRVTHEHALALALRDQNPVTVGHTLVVSRRHVVTYFDATAAEQAALWELVDEVRRDLDAQLERRPDGYTVGFDAGLAAGQTVMHAHIHVIPRYEGDTDHPQRGVRDVIALAPKVAEASSRARVVAGGLQDPLLPQILPALDGADRVDLALAFVFDAGVELLHDRLVDVLRRPGARVRVLTGDYQGVTEPAALRHLLQLPGIATGAEAATLELRAYRVQHNGQDSFHPKAWIVRGPGVEIAWVGSSNLSRVALATGLEWNYQIVEQGDVAGVRRSFEALWKHPSTVNVDDDWVDAYERTRRPPQRGGHALVVAAQDDPPPTAAEPRPGIQTEALLRLEQTRLQGNRAGLVVLATGLGKTFLSAFDSKKFRRVLFVAHREEILTQALETFRRVRPGSRLGLYYGKEKDPRADVLFASVQTLSQPDHMEGFAPDHFDYLIVDEFHHAAADTYRRVIEYFAPEFMLGLTATPDRLDGFNLLALCDGNLVYDCAIPRGIADEQLSPFHYFGIGDEAEYEKIPWRSYTDDRLEATVATEARAEHALQTLRKYTNGRVRALAFCVTKSHADFMERHFLARGVECAAVYSGSKAPRTATLEALARGDLEIVFCVDMFNEGVDVPSIDTIFMLRPTQSSIVWLQQLGRGLRYVGGKTLTVLDYIGNHTIFSRRPEMLLQALEITYDGPHQLWREGNFDAVLPPGTQVTFDLQAQEVLESLREHAKRAGNKAQRWYREFRDVRGLRPTAVEAEHAGWFKQLSKRGGGWLAFVAAEGDLDEKAAAVYTAHAAFFRELERLEHTHSSPMLVLLGSLAVGPFPGRIHKKSISTWVAVRVRRSAALMRDLEISSDDPTAIEQRLDEVAFPRVAEMAGGAFFAHSKQHFDSSALRTESPGALADLTRELVELHLDRYLESANRSSTNLPPLHDDDGTLVDARFDVEAIGDRSTIVFHSRGDAKSSADARNTEYKRGLGIVLRRLAGAGIDIERVEVISEHKSTRGLAQAERTVAVADHSYPIRASDVLNPVALAHAIGNGAKKVGQKPGTKGGNDTKRIRITPAQHVPAGELWWRLFRA
jgi:superfamily II DNA or RNA helicase/diadenosine tetraphosphate (Ap4A) HIT family hydrolase/HKD family nuclease